jgi:glycosyltransferase involved in cell wall biosynthesis
MAHGLSQLAMNEEGRVSLRKAGLDRAAQFDWQRTAEQTLEVYKRTARMPQTASTPMTFSPRLSSR